MPHNFITYTILCQLITEKNEQKQKKIATKSKVSEKWGTNWWAQLLPKSFPWSTT